MNTIRKNLTLLAMGVCAAFALTSATPRRWPASR